MLELNTVNNETAYIFIASGFILLLNLMAFITLRVNYHSTRKPYLLLASVAIALEALRQIPALMLSFNPESYAAVLLSFFLQFSASWMLLCAIIRKEGDIDSSKKRLLGSLVGLYVICTATTLVRGYPEETLDWLIVTLPSILAVLVILWKIRRIEIAALSGKILLILSGLSLASIRIALLIVDSNELVYLLFYLDVLIVPILVAALVFAEIESAHLQVNSLLNEKTRAAADLQFILDNSADISLTVSNAGLLLTWNRRAESVFGYTSAQTIQKMYIDELFSGNYCHKNVDQEEVISATMERIDGKSFTVNASMKTVTENSGTYTIYVINEGEIDH